MDQAEEVTAVSSLQPVDHIPQAYQPVASELRPSVTYPLLELDPTPSVLLVHQEAQASAPLVCLEALASAPQVDSPASTPDKEHQAVSHLLVHLEAPASARQVQLVLLDQAREESPEAAALL